MGNKFNSFGDYGYVENVAFEAKTYEVSISENDKIISVTENGSLLATVKLGLDNQTLSLIGKDGKEFSSVVLPSASVVESARYDEEKQALILTIKLADGTTKEIEISFTDMLDDYAKKEDVEKNTQAIKDEATTRAEADAKFTEKDIEIENTISTLDDRLTAKDAEIDEALTKKVDLTELEYEGGIRKAIVLGNHDTILGETTSGGTVNIAMVNKWDVVDLGTTSLPINLNTPKGVRPTVQEAGQSGEDANKIAYLSEIIGLNATDNLLTSKIAVLEEKLEKLYKTAVENVELNGESEATFSDESKDYIISGEETKSTAITGKTVKLDNLSIYNNARTTINASDVEIKNVNISGDFPKANGNAVVKINNAEYVVVRDMVFDSSNVYNGIEIGLSSETLPKSILFENCKFLGQFSNNAILIFGTQDNAIININNCYFENLSNPFRLSNNTNVKCTMNITNCKIDKWDVNSPWQGMMLMQDYTSGDSDKANENNLFAPEKITINVINTIGPNNKKITMPSDISTICGTGDEKQLFYIWDEYRNLVPYDKSKYPTINIM